MHARYYLSAGVGRFQSIDPIQGTPGTSQSWNLYTYVENNPLKSIDPRGEDLYIVYSFEHSGLTQKQQNTIVKQVRQQYINAGVINVYSMFAGGSTVPSGGALGSKDARVDINFTSKPIGSEGKLGRTKVSAQKSTVTTARMPPGEAGTTLLTNVAGHEIGHGTKAMPDYDYDAAPIGTAFHSNPAKAGSLMEAQVGGQDADLQIQLLSSEIREFSKEDAKELRETLNEPED